MKTLLLIMFLVQNLQAAFSGQHDAIICDSISIGKYHELHVSSSINVILVDCDAHYAFIEGTASSIASVRLKQEGDKLYISRKGISDKGKLFVYLPIHSLRIIEAEDGARVSSYNPVKGDTLVLSASDESSIMIMTEASVVRSSSGKNGSIELFDTPIYSFVQKDENGISFIELKKVETAEVY